MAMDEMRSRASFTEISPSIDREIQIAKGYNFLVSLAAGTLYPEV